jgi:predicted ATPase
LDSPDILAIKGLGQFQKFKQVAAFRRLIEGWHVSDFHIQVARASVDAGYAEHLSPTGENLPLVAQFMHEHYPERFQRVLQKMAERVPGIVSVEATETADGRIVLRFQDDAFRDPFVARYVSDGTLKMFAYLLQIPGVKFIVVRDQDSADCIQVKERLRTLCIQSDHPANKRQGLIFFRRCLSQAKMSKS